MQKPPLIIWDFDGTLADSLAMVERFLVQLAPEYGIATPTKAQIATWRGMELRAVLAELGLSWRKMPGLLVKVQRNMAAQISSIPPVEGLEAVIVELARHYRFALTSSNSSQNVGRWLDVQGWRGWFETLVTGSSLTGKAKHFRSLVKSSGTPKHRVVVIGDELRDVDAARACGLPYVVVAWGFQSEAGLREAGLLPIVRPEQLEEAIRQALAGAA